MPDNSQATAPISYLTPQQRANQLASESAIQGIGYAQPTSQPAPQQTYVEQPTNAMAASTAAAPVAQTAMMGQTNAIGSQASTVMGSPANQAAINTAQQSSFNPVASQMPSSYTGISEQQYSRAQTLYQQNLGIAAESRSRGNDSTAPSFEQTLMFVSRGEKQNLDPSYVGSGYFAPGDFYGWAAEHGIPFSYPGAGTVGQMMGRNADGSFANPAAEGAAASPNTNNPNSMFMSQYGAPAPYVGAMGSIPGINPQGPVGSYTGSQDAFRQQINVGMQSAGLDQTMQANVRANAALTYAQSPGTFNDLVRGVGQTVTTNQYGVGVLGESTGNKLNLAQTPTAFATNPFAMPTEKTTATTPGLGSAAAIAAFVAGTGGVVGGTLAKKAASQGFIGGVNTSPISDINGDAMSNKQAKAAASAMPELSSGANFGNYYVPYGSFTQTEIQRTAGAINPISGELAFYQRNKNIDTGEFRQPSLISGGGIAAAQSGMFTANKPQTPFVVSQERAGIDGPATAEQTKGMSRLGAEAYGGEVRPLDNRTIQSTGAQLSTYPNNPNNLANYADPQGVNRNKADMGLSKIPWTAPENSPYLQTMGPSGLTGTPAVNRLTGQTLNAERQVMGGETPSMAAPAAAAPAATTTTPGIVSGSQPFSLIPSVTAAEQAPGTGAGLFQPKPEAAPNTVYNQGLGVNLALGSKIGRDENFVKVTGVDVKTTTVESTPSLGNLVSNTLGAAGNEIFGVVGVRPFEQTAGFGSTTTTVTRTIELPAPFVSGAPGFVGTPTTMTTATTTTNKEISVYEAINKQAAAAIPQISVMDQEAAKADTSALGYAKNAAIGAYSFAAERPLDLVKIASEAPIIVEAGGLAFGAAGKVAAGTFAEGAVAGATRLAPAAFTAIYGVGAANTATSGFTDFSTTAAQKGGAEITKAGAFFGSAGLYSNPGAILNTARGIDARFSVPMDNAQGTLGRVTSGKDFEGTSAGKTFDLTNTPTERATVARNAIDQAPKQSTFVSEPTVRTVDLTNVGTSKATVSRNPIDRAPAMPAEFRPTTMRTVDLTNAPTSGSTVSRNAIDRAPKLPTYVSEPTVRVVDLTGTAPSSAAVSRNAIDRAPAMPAELRPQTVRSYDLTNVPQSKASVSRNAIDQAPKQSTFVSEPTLRTFDLTNTPTSRATVSRNAMESAPMYDLANPSFKGVTMKSTGPTPPAPKPGDSFGSGAGVGAGSGSRQQLVMRPTELKSAVAEPMTSMKPTELKSMFAEPTTSMRPSSTQVVRAMEPTYGFTSEAAPAEPTSGMSLKSSPMSKSDTSFATSMMVETGTLSTPSEAMPTSYDTTSKESTPAMPGSSYFEPATDLTTKTFETSATDTTVMPDRATGLDSSASLMTPLSTPTTTPASGTYSPPSIGPFIMGTPFAPPVPSFGGAGAGSGMRRGSRKYTNTLPVGLDISFGGIASELFGRSNAPTRRSAAKFKAPKMPKMPTMPGMPKKRKSKR